MDQLMETLEGAASSQEEFVQALVHVTKANHKEIKFLKDTARKHARQIDFMEKQIGYVQKRWWDLDMEKAATNLHVGKIPGEWDEQKRRTWMKNTLKDIKDTIVQKELGYISEPIIKTHNPRTGKMNNFLTLVFDDQNDANILKQGWYKYYGQIELVVPYNHEQMWYKSREWKVSLSNIKTPTVRLIEMIMDCVVNIYTEKGEIFEDEFELRQREMEGKLIIKATKEAITSIHLDQTDNKVALLTATPDLAEALERYWEDTWKFETYRTEWEHFAFAFKFGVMKPESDEKGKGKGKHKSKGKDKGKQGKEWDDGDGQTSGRICHFYARGNCRNGSSCRFQHVRSGSA